MAKTLDVETIANEEHKESFIDDSGTEPHIRIPRSFFQGPLWKKHRKWSEAEAWIGLLVEARYSETEAEMMIGTKLIKWGKNQLPGSTRFLAAKWGWGKDKVKEFLDLLVKEKAIEVDKKQGQTIITITRQTSRQTQGQQSRQRQVHADTPPVIVTSESPDRDQPQEPTLFQTVTGTKQREGRDKVVKKNENKDKAIVYAFNEIEFIDQFNRWLQFLKSKKRGPIAQESIEEQNEFLKKYSLEISLEILKYSIRGGYKTLYPPKIQENGKQYSGSRQTRDQAVNDYINATY